MELKSLQTVPTVGVRGVTTAGPTTGGDDNGDPMVTVDPSAGPTAAGGDDDGIRGVPTEGPTTGDCEANGSASGDGVSSDDELVL